MSSEYHSLPKTAECCGCKVGGVGDSGPVFTGKAGLTSSSHPPARFRPHPPVENLGSALFGPDRTNLVPKRGRLVAHFRFEPRHKQPTPATEPENLFVPCCCCCCCLLFVFLLLLLFFVLFPPVLFCSPAAAVLYADAAAFLFLFCCCCCNARGLLHTQRGCSQGPWEPPWAVPP